MLRTECRVKVANAPGSGSSSQAMGMVFHHRGCFLGQCHWARSADPTQATPSSSNYRNYSNLLREWPQRDCPGIICYLSAYLSCFGRMAIHPLGLWNIAVSRWLGRRMVLSHTPPLQNPNAPYWLFSVC